MTKINKKYDLAGQVRNRIVERRMMKPGEIEDHPSQWRDHNLPQADAMAGVLREVGIASTLKVWKSERAGGRYVAWDGHLRKSLDPDLEWPVDILDITDAEADYLLSVFDPISAMATADAGALDALLSSVQSGEAGVQAMLAELAEEAGLYAPGEASDDNPLDFDAARASLADRFLVPPFSVLDARQGYWQDRKRAWIALGIESELGRGSTASTSSLARIHGQDLMRGEHVVGGLTWTTGAPRTDETSRKILATGRRNRGRAYHDHDWQRETLGNVQAPEQASGTSIFDPVLCELAYTWFTAPGAHILDPFAGGSVRGIVATYLGRDYTGIDLRPEQIAANQHQAAAIVPGRLPRWIVGNSLNAIPAEDYDLIFTCPPYYDLEVYSDDPEDLSNKEDYGAFLNDYRAIIAQAVERLRADRFACVVVGDIRDRKGMYRNFVADTIAVFRDAGMALYNEAILVTAVGSLSIRVGRQFEAGRKLGKTHQNVLVFVKGDPRKATAWCGPVEIGTFGEALEGADEVGA